MVLALYRMKNVARVTIAQARWGLFGRPYQNCDYTLV